MGELLASGAAHRLPFFKFFEPPLVIIGRIYYGEKLPAAHLGVCPAVKFVHA